MGYYRQDFHNFDFDATVMECLEQASNLQHDTQELRRVAANFLLRWVILSVAVGVGVGASVCRAAGCTGCAGPPRSLASLC